MGPKIPEAERKRIIEQRAVGKEALARIAHQFLQERGLGPQLLQLAAKDLESVGKRLVSLDLVKLEEGLRQFIRQHPSFRAITLPQKERMVDEVVREAIENVQTVRKAVLAMVRGQEWERIRQMYGELHKMGTPELRSLRMFIHVFPADALEHRLNSLKRIREDFEQACSSLIKLIGSTITISPQEKEKLIKDVQEFARRRIREFEEMINKVEERIVEEKRGREISSIRGKIEALGASTFEIEERLWDYVSQFLASEEFRKHILLLFKLNILTRPIRSLENMLEGIKRAIENTSMENKSVSEIMESIEKSEVLRDEQKEALKNELRSKVERIRSILEDMRGILEEVISQEKKKREVEKLIPRVWDEVMRVRGTLIKRDRRLLSSLGFLNVVAGEEFVRIAMRYEYGLVEEEVFENFLKDKKPGEMALLLTAYCSVRAPENRDFFFTSLEDFVLGKIDAKEFGRRIKEKAKGKIVDVLVKRLGQP